MKFELYEEVWTLYGNEPRRGVVMVRQDGEYDVTLKNRDGSLPGERDGSITMCGLSERRLHKTTLDAERSLIRRWKRIQVMVDKAIADMELNYDNQGYMPVRVEKLERMIQEED